MTTHRSSQLRLLPWFLLPSVPGALAADGSHAAAVIPAGAHATTLSLAAIAGGAVTLFLLLAWVWHFSRTRMRQWTVTRRLSLGFAALLLVLASLAAESYFSLHTALTDFTGYRADARHTNLAAGIQIEFLEMQVAEQDLALTRDDRSIGRYQAHHRELMELLAQAEQQIEDADLKLHVAGLVKGAAEHARLHEELQAAVRADDGALVATLGERMKALGETIDNHAQAIETAFLAQQNTDGPRMAAELAHTQSVVIWLGLAAIALGIGLTLIISRSISGPLQVLAAGLGAGAEQTAAAAGQVSSSSQSLAQGASEQAASLEETSASLEELSSMTKRNADSSQGAQKVASETRSAALGGAEQMSAMQTAMERINRASQDITKVLRTIDEIAFQTNILALNAAIEAARAGEQGAGFAVVAEEVRALAQRSAGAARETASMIERSLAESRQGVEISSKVAGSFNNIQGRVEKLDELVTEIASASGEQSKGIEQITQAVSQMDQVTQSNAGSAEETAAAAEELNAQAVMLKDAVAQLQALAGVKILKQHARETLRSIKAAAAPKPELTAV